MYLFPRLPDAYARLLAEEYRSLEPEDVRTLSNRRKNSHATNTTYAATGGPRIDLHYLERLLTEIEDLALASGFPQKLNAESQRRFDFLLLKILADMPMFPAESSRNDVWQHLTCVGVPHIVSWRHGGQDASIERFLGGNRNALQRLLLRARLLATPLTGNRWAYLDPQSRDWLNEDQQVALSERTSLARSPALCSAVARAYHAIADYVPASVPSPTQTLFREAMKRLMRDMAYIRISALDMTEMESLAENSFKSALRALGGDLGLIEETSPVTTSVLELVASNLSPELFTLFEEFYQETSADELDHLFRIATAHTAWLHQQSNLRKVIEIALAESLARSLEQLFLIGKTSESQDLKRVVATALHYYVSEDDAIEYDQPNGYEDDRDVVNAVANALGRPDLAVHWLEDSEELRIPPGLRDHFLQLIPKARHFENAEEALRNHRSFLLMKAGTGIPINQQHIEGLTRGYLSMLATRESLSEFNQSLLLAGILYFIESDDAVSDLGPDGLDDDVQVFNALIHFFGRLDLEIRGESIAQVDGFQLVKRLSPNDVGDTGSHQAGIHLSKFPEIFEAIPALAVGVKNPESMILAEGPDRTEWEFRVVYYNNKYFDGTRDEMRITRIGGFLHHFNLRAGDALVLRYGGDWQLEFVREEDLGSDFTEDGWKLLKNDDNSFR